MFLNTYANSTTYNSPKNKGTKRVPRRVSLIKCGIELLTRQNEECSIRQTLSVGEMKTL